MSARLRVSLRPSRRLAAGIAVSHGIALAAAVIALTPFPALIVALGLALSSVHHLRIALHRSALTIAGLELSSDGSLALASPAGEWASGELRAAAVPAAWLTVLIARDDNGRRRALVVLPDACDPEGFRRLRMWLLWRGAAAPFVDTSTADRR